jgi:hypothetical protein
MKASEFLAKYPSLYVESILIATPKWNDKGMYEFRFRLTLEKEKLFFAYWMGKGCFPENRRVKADTNEFLECISRECQDYVNNPDIDDFLDDFGMENTPNNIAIYEECRKNVRKIKGFMPREMLQDFLTIQDEYS